MIDLLDSVLRRIGNISARKRRGWKWKPCQNDSSKPVYVGTKSRVYVSIPCK